MDNRNKYSLCHICSDSTCKRRAHDSLHHNGNGLFIEFQNNVPNHPTTQKIGQDPDHHKFNQPEKVKKAFKDVFRVA